MFHIFSYLMYILTLPCPIIKGKKSLIMDEIKIQKQLRQFAKKRDWEKFHNLKNLAVSISLESSELLEIFQWQNENSISWKDKKILRMIEDEIADIMLYLLRFADIAKIDIEKVCEKKIKKNKKRYPIKFSKGISTKYNKLRK